MRLLELPCGSSREELLESGGEFSVEELIDVGLSGKRGDKERRLLFVNDYVPLFVPYFIKNSADTCRQET